MPAARTLLATVTVTVALAGAASAQTITTQQTDEILKELRAIRQAVEELQTPAPPPAGRPPSPDKETIRLDSHPQAKPAARAARCAGDQGKFWELRLALVKNAGKLSPAFIAQQAGALKLDMTQFDTRTTGTTYDSAINKDMAEAASFDVSGTPTFFVGKTTAQGFEGLRIVGAQPYAVFHRRIEGLLK